MPVIVEGADCYENGLTRLVEYTDICAHGQRELIAYILDRRTRRHFVRLITPDERCAYTGLSISRQIERHHDVIAWFLEDGGPTSWGHMAGVSPEMLEGVMLDFIPPEWNLPD